MDPRYTSTCREPMVAFAHSSLCNIQMTLKENIVSISEEDVAQKKRISQKNTENNTKLGIK